MERDEVTAQTRAVLWAGKADTRKERQRRRRVVRAACPHAIVRWKQVPHPRYGDRVPHFVSWTEPLTDDHPCVVK